MEDKKMANIYKGTLGLIGNTPLVEVTNLEKKQELKARVLVKLEYLNPAGSVKDRIAKAMLEDAEQKGKLKEGSVIIEPTSGNTGIGLAAIAASKGYRVILTMPETMSVERRNILKAYGAEIVLTQGVKGMNWQQKFPTALFRDSSKTLPIRKHTARRPVRRSGGIRTARWTSLLPVSAPAVLSAVPVNI